VFHLDRSIIIGLCGAAYLHVVYAYRNHFSWARANVNFLKKLAARDNDSIVLFWAIGVEIILFIVIVTSRIPR